MCSSNQSFRAEKVGSYVLATTEEEKVVQYRSDYDWDYISVFKADRSLELLVRQSIHTCGLAEPHSLVCNATFLKYKYSFKKEKAD